ncbi:hypothetical protein CC78DRAFT_552170 [Lojkania enalia]|uniref:tRNA-splicing endonuclease subunit Sen54 N-terminal domain-containing protein n=1 Tax=Lojkania enalia TaxID=147567 RepID=A0A9P4N2D0_9PLEO|nr:hypothetical protein CC78DRAFT_552170 [Didymosphaeria enalia]
MADEDEDASLLWGNNVSEETDLSDETQDFRFLNNLTAHDTGNLSLPKRGEKDFESHATNLQHSMLEASRQAMHGVLSWTRVHGPKQHILGMYHPMSNMAFVTNPKSQHFRTVGRAKGSTQWLLPEEALFLIERGSMDCRWPVKEDEGDDGPIDTQEGVPMSLQGAYAAFLGFEGGVGGKLTQEMYTVYAGLKRSGYIVFRMGTWNYERGELQVPSLENPATKEGNWFLRLFGGIWRRLTQASTEMPAKQLYFGPVVKPGLYRSYSDIYRLLQLTPFHDRMAAPTFILPPDHTNPFRVVFDVYKTDPKFKKSACGPPDFRIAVINARETSMPTAAQLNDLFATTPYDLPKQNMQLYQKLKHGSRNVILAVVDNGIPSYIRIADSPFAEEKLYERSVHQGNKRGKGRGGRGRGKGRGRGR